MSPGVDFLEFVDGNVRVDCCFQLKICRAYYFSALSPGYEAVNKLPAPIIFLSQSQNGAIEVNLFSGL